MNVKTEEMEKMLNLLRLFLTQLTMLKIKIVHRRARRIIYWNLRYKKFYKWYVSHT